MIHKPIITKAGTELPLTDMKGKPYLQVAYRLVWFREEHPDWTIKTHLAHPFNLEFALVEAEIFNEAGRLIASDRKCVTHKSFQAYVEKATTGAIGRALALCGYGTQFDPEEFDDETNIQHVADTPVPRPKTGTLAAPLSPEVALELNKLLESLKLDKEYAIKRYGKLFPNKHIKDMTTDECKAVINSIYSESQMK